MRRIRIATRRSRLAMTQAEFVASRLKADAPGLAVELVGLTSQGDRDQSPSLAQAGGKSSFVGALEEAVRDGRADVAVHSMKDVAVRVPDGFALHTFGPRADVRDALVLNGVGFLVRRDADGIAERCSRGHSEHKAPGAVADIAPRPRGRAGPG